MIKVTAGLEALGEFAPQFAKLNDEVLLGEVWSRDKELSPKIRSIITVTSLLTSGVFDSSLSFHLQKAKENGVSKTEIGEILTQLAFYSGWPKAWAAFRMAKDIWTDKTDYYAVEKNSLFPIGKPNDAFKQYFVGQSYLSRLTTNGVNIANVTFEPSCRNNWHIHRADKRGGQILLCVEGEGWYQEWGKPAKRLKGGDVVVIPAGVKHWHGATADSWFAHLAVEVTGENTSTEWLETVSDEAYNSL